MDTIKHSFELISQEARKDGAQVEMMLTSGQSIELRYQKKTLETFKANQSQMAGLRVLLAGQQGYAFTERLDADSLMHGYREALSNAKTVKKNDVIEFDLPTPSAFPKIDGLKESKEIPMEDKMKVAEQAESLCFAKDSRVQSVPYASFNEGSSKTRILNSNGMDQSYEAGLYRAWAYPMSKSGESSKVAGKERSVRRFQDLDIDELTTDAVKKSTELLGAEKIPSGVYPVIIAGDQGATVLAMLSSYFSARKVDEKKSLFKDKMNQVIGSPKWNLIDDPLNTAGTAARPFDAEGSPSKKVTLIEKGVLKNFLTSVEYSKRMNLPLTSHAYRTPTTEMDISPSNMYLQLGTSSREELLQRYPKVLLITEFTAGMHSSFKELTGDISMPCEGLLYENGKLVKPVEQFILAANILDLLAKTEEVGNKYQGASGNYFCPDLLISSVNITGQS